MVTCACMLLCMHPAKKGAHLAVQVCSYRIHSVHQHGLMHAVQETQVSPDALTRNGLTIVCAVHCAVSCHSQAAAVSSLDKPRALT